MANNVVYEGRINVGAKQAVTNVQSLETKLGNLSKTNKTTAVSTEKLTDNIDKSAGAMGGFQNAVTSFQMLMQGNFVGAMNAGAAAVNALWKAIIANPVAGAVIAIATLATGVYAYFANMKKRAKEHREEMKRIKDDWEAWKKSVSLDDKPKTSVEIAQEKANATDSKVDAISQRNIAQKTHERLLEEAEYEQGQREDWVNAKQGRKKEDYYSNEVIETLQKAVEDADKKYAIWKAKVIELDAKEKQLREKKYADEDAKFKAQQAQEKAGAEEVAKLKEEFLRKQMADQIKDPVNKLTFQRQLLLEDKEKIDGDGSEAELARLAIDQKLYELDKQITAEREKQKKLAEDEKRLKQDALAPVEAVTPETLSEPEKKKSKRRGLGTRNATSWFKAQMKARREAMGVERLTLDTASGKWLSKEEMKQKENVKPLTKAEQAQIEMKDDIKKVREVLAGS
jgi:hypothetical protein